MKQAEKFTDESDRATALEEAAIEASLSQIRINANKLEFEATGFCLNCDEKLEEGHRFCNKDCMEDFTKRQRK